MSSDAHERRFFTSGEEAFPGTPQWNVAPIRDITRKGLPVGSNTAKVLDEDDEFHTGCTENCPDECWADHKGEQ